MTSKYHNPFTAAECARLSALRDAGTSWADIQSEAFPARSVSALKNKYYTMRQDQGAPPLPRGRPRKTERIQFMREFDNKAFERMVKRGTIALGWAIEAMKMRAVG